MASAMKLRDTDPAERVLDYLTTLAREQDVHVVTLDAIIGACDIRPLKWPELLNKLADKVEAAPGRDAYRLRKKRDLMARLTDEERVVGHLLKGPASPAEIRQALKAILMARLTDEETGPQPPPVEATPMVEERAPPSTPEVEAIPEEQPQGSAALRKAVADHVGMSELASDGDLLEGLETMRAIVAAEHMAVQETRAALAAARAERDEEARMVLGWEPLDPVITKNPTDGPAVFCEVCFADFTKGERRGVFPAGHPDAFGVEPLAGKPAHPECIRKGIARIDATRAATERRLAEDAAAMAATTAALDGIEGHLDRARDRLADAENSLNTIEMVPLASDDIPF